MNIITLANRENYLIFSAALWIIRICGIIGAGFALWLLFQTATKSTPIWPNGIIQAACLAIISGILWFVWSIQFKMVD